jgi:hypothetical protein
MRVSSSCYTCATRRVALVANTVVNSDVPGGYAVPATHVPPVVLLLHDGWHICVAGTAYPPGTPELTTVFVIRVT